MIKGSKHTPETRAKIRAARIRQVFPESSRKKWSLAFTGRKITWADKIRKTLMGHSVSAETRKRLSMAGNGKFAGEKNPAKRPEVREKIRLSKLGNKNPNWKGGVTKSMTGYAFIRIGRSYVAVHRLVMEQMIGRQLQKDEIVHHINKNHRDNRKENLALCNNIAAHRWCHTEKANGFLGNWNFWLGGTDGLGQAACYDG